MADAVGDFNVVPNASGVNYHDAHLLRVLISGSLCPSLLTVWETLRRYNRWRKDQNLNCTKMSINGRSRIGRIWVIINSILRRSLTVRSKRELACLPSGKQAVNNSYGCFTSSFYLSQSPLPVLQPRFLSKISP